MIQRTAEALLITLLFLSPVISIGSGRTPLQGSTGGFVMSGGDMIIHLDVADPEIGTWTLNGFEWSVIDMEGAIHPPSEGGPSLPFISHPLRVPFEIGDIHVLRKDPKEFHLLRPLAPSGKVVPFNSEFTFDPGMDTVDIDRDLYQADRTYPFQVLKWSRMGYGWDTGERLAHYSVSVCPFDYNPTTGLLTLYRNISLVIEREAPSALDISLAISRATERPSQVREGTELLVISYDPFVNDLDEYVQWKREKGLTVSVVKYSLVNGAYPSLGGAQSIWQFVHDTFFGDGKQLKWVLLAGEPKYVPSLMAWDMDPYQGEPSTLPADTYFACLDGSYDDWDGDGDGKWAELGDITDYVPDVYVSRVSSDTDQETLNWARKVVRYERNPEVGPWTSRVGLFGSTTHETDDGPRQCEYLWSSYLSSVYDTPDKYYSVGQVQQQAGAKALTYSNVDQGMRSGLSTIVYMGHGYYAMWTEGPQNDASFLYGTDEARTISQSPRLPFITAMSCETNWFDNPNWDSISEAFIENPNGGAIGYVGASRTTEGGIGYYDYLPGAPGIQEDVLRMMKNGRVHQAEIFHEAKSHYVDSWGAWFNSYQFAYNAWVEHNILGSPETSIWINPISSFSVTVDHTSDYYSNFTVNVKDGSGRAVKDAVVTVYSEDLSLSSKGLTDGYGNVVIPFIISQPAYATVTVTKRDFKPYQKEIYISDDTPPETTLELDRPVPDGSSGWYRADPGIHLASSEPGEIYYRWNGGSSFEYDGTVQTLKGDNIFEYWSEDLSGNEEEYTTVTLKYDPDTPLLEYEVTPTSPDGENGWYNTLPVILTSISGSEASPQRVDYWWGMGAREMSNGTIFALQGDNTLHLQAVDEAGNRDEEVVIHFKVDSIPPETILNTGGEKKNGFGWYTSPMMLELTCSDRSAETYYRWSGTEEWTVYRDPVTPPQGNNTFYFHSIDIHGNQEEVRSFQVPYDTVSPDIEAEITPAMPDGALGWYITRPVVSLFTTDEYGSSIVYYTMDGGTEQVFSSALVIPDGKHSLVAHAVDQAGNKGLTWSMEFKVDTVTEETVLSMDSSPDDEGWITDVPMIFLRSTEGTIIYYSWNGEGDMQAYNGGILPPGEEGEFFLTYYCVDEAGNRERTRTATFLVDAVGPKVVVTPPISPEAGKEVLFDLSFTTDEGSGVEAYFIDFGDGDQSGWLEEPLIAHTYSKGGTYEVTILARDEAGHESSEEITVEVAETGTPTVILVGAVGGALLFLILMVLILLLILTKRKEHRMHPPHPRHHYFHHHAHLQGGKLPHQGPPVNRNQVPVKQVSPPHIQGGGNVGYIRPPSGNQAPAKRPGPQPPSPPPPPRMPEVPAPPAPPL